MEECDTNEACLLLKSRIDVNLDLKDNGRWEKSFLQYSIALCNLMIHCVLYFVTKGPPLVVLIIWIFQLVDELITCLFGKCFQKVRKL